MAFKLTDEQVKELEAFGFSSVNQIKFLAKDSADALRTIASDSSFQENSNGVPAFFTTIWTNTMIDQVVKAMTASIVGEEMQQGDWTTTNVKVPTRSFTYQNAPYGDFSLEGQSGDNYNWENRQVYKMQNNIQYGDSEVDTMATGKIDVVGSKRQSQAIGFAQDFNTIFYFGKDGMEIYGLINDPDNNPAIPSSQNAAGTSTYLKDKDPNEIYNTVLDMYTELSAENGGNITMQDKMYLILSPKLAPLFNKVTQQFLKSAKAAIAENLPNLEFVEAPQYDNIGTMQLVLDNVLGQRVVYNAFTYKFRSHGVIRERSAYVEKASAGTAGAIVAYPAGVCTMTGVSPTA